jgi:UDP-glucose 4-epimerase
MVEGNGYEAEIDDRTSNTTRINCFMSLSMSKILITGANGFIGKSLLDYLIAAVGIAKEDILLLSSHVHTEYETLTYDKISYSIPSVTNISGVIHLGAFIPKSSAESDDIELSLSNIIFTKNLLKSIPHKINRFVFASTVDVYDSNVDMIDEKSYTNPATLYGWSKLYCEQMVAKWCEMHQIPYQILRLGHIYGVGEDAYKKIIPITIKKILKDESPVIFSKGEEKRSFLNVKDCVRMICDAYHFPIKENRINIVSNKSYRILDIVKTIIQVSGKDLKPEILNQTTSVRDYLFDNQLMRELFGEERIELMNGLTDEYNYFSKAIK